MIPSQNEYLTVELYEPLPSALTSEIRNYNSQQQEKIVDPISDTNSHFSEELSEGGDEYRNRRLAGEIENPIMM